MAVELPNHLAKQQVGAGDLVGIRVPTGTAYGDPSGGPGDSVQLMEWWLYLEDDAPTRVIIDVGQESAVSTFINFSVQTQVILTSLTVLIVYNTGFSAAFLITIAGNIPLNEWTHFVLRARDDNVTYPSATSGDCTLYVGRTGIGITGTPVVPAPPTPAFPSTYLAFPFISGNSSQGFRGWSNNPSHTPIGGFGCSRVNVPESRRMEGGLLEFRMWADNPETPAGLTEYSDAYIESKRQAFVTHSLDDEFIAGLKHCFRLNEAAGGTPAGYDDAGDTAFDLAFSVEDSANTPDGGGGFGGHPFATLGPPPIVFVEVPIEIAGGSEFLSPVVVTNKQVTIAFDGSSIVVFTVDVIEKAFFDHFDGPTLTNRWTEVTVAPATQAFNTDGLGSYLRFTDLGLGASFIYLKDKIITTESQIIAACIRLVSQTSFLSDVMFGFMNPTSGTPTVGDTNLVLSEARWSAGLIEDPADQGIWFRYDPDNNDVPTRYRGEDAPSAQNSWVSLSTEPAVEGVNVGLFEDFVIIGCELDATNLRFRFFAIHKNEQTISELDLGGRIVALSEWVLFSAVTTALTNLFLCIGFRNDSAAFGGQMDLEWVRRDHIDNTVRQTGFTSAAEAGGNRFIRRHSGYGNIYLPEDRGVTNIVLAGGGGDFDENGTDLKALLEF